MEAVGEGEAAPTVDAADLWKDNQLTSAVTLTTYAGSQDSTYYFAVSAVDNNTNESNISAADSATAIDATPPSAPTNLVATGGEMTVTLAWDDDPDANTWNIYRGITTGNTYLIDTGIATNSYTDYPLTADSTYFYTVTAVDLASNESSKSNEDSDTTTGMQFADQPLYLATDYSWLSGNDTIPDYDDHATYDVSILSMQAGYPPSTWPAGLGGIANRWQNVADSLRTRDADHVTLVYMTMWAVDSFWETAPTNTGWRKIWDYVEANNAWARDVNGYIVYK